MKVALIQGHPDAEATHFDHALAAAYAEAARAAGHEVREIAVAKLDFPLLRTAAQWTGGPIPAPIRDAQDTIAWAEHLVIVFPLWLGDMPALLKAFFEQCLRPGFALGKAPQGRMPPKLLKGRRNILEFCGVAPVSTTLIGMVEKGKACEAWLAKLERLGRDGA